MVKQTVPLNDLPQYRDDLQDLLSLWDPNDVYNCDKTALYWKIKPSKTLSAHPLKGTKQPKDRVTFFLLVTRREHQNLFRPLFNISIQGILRRLIMLAYRYIIIGVVVRGCSRIFSHIGYKN